MKTHFLFPRQFKKIGWLLFVPALLTVVALSFTEINPDDYVMVKVFAILNDGVIGDYQVFGIIENAISDEILLSMLIIGGLLVGFSKHRYEDEMIAKIRYESLVWAVYVNFAVMLFATIFVYGLYYFQVLVANVFTMLFFFICRFHLMLYKLNNSAKDEE